MIATRRKTLARPSCCFALCVLTLVTPVPAATAAEQAPGLQVRKEPYGRMPDGAAVDLYTLSNAQGLEAKIMTLGATLTTFQAPDRNGKTEIITLHKESLADYLRGHPLFGSVVGRYANRIAGAAFTIDGREHRLDANAGKHHIHGGIEGFHRLVWQAEPLHEPDAAGVRLRLDSADGQAGYPGKLQATMIYKLTADNRLVMDYTATTDQPTHVNLTNHTYWNLGGAEGGDVFGHVLLLNADCYLPADEALIPTGEIRSVNGTPLDFTLPHTIGGRIDQVEGRRYDHCYVLNHKPNERLVRAARVVEPASGRTMEVWTTQPGVQLYTGNPRGLCLETQHYPDTPHHPNFPSTLLRPGETFHETTVHHFGVLSP
jgi:aldose 1-epimerase